MANSKYAYVRSFELPDSIIPSTFMVVRLDGHAFHRFSSDHGFEKPNDDRALRLMDVAAKHVMKSYPEVAMAFGESDEFSFLLRKSCNLYNRRSRSDEPSPAQPCRVLLTEHDSKIASTFASLFSASYTFSWAEFFPETPLQYPPSFDGRVVAYPSSKEIMDYFAWRQADTHINNLYNTTFWALVLKGKMSTAEAHNALKGTTSSQKQETLFSKFQINYSILPERFRKGSVLYRQIVTEPGEAPIAGTMGDPVHEEGTQRIRSRKEVVVRHCDIIGRTFWEEQERILDDKEP